MTRTILAILALAIVGPACAGTETDPPGPGRLVIVDDTGNIATATPDGATVTAVTDDAGGRVTYFQPIWSPDTSHVSVTRSEAGAFSVDVIDVANGETSRTTTATSSFYAFWSPDGTQLAYLSSVTPQDLALDVIAVAEPEAETRKGLGQPLYFSWSPDSTGLVSHIGSDRLEIVMGDDEASPLALPGQFPSPQWTDRGIVYVVAAGGGQQLVRSQPAGEADLLASLSGGAVFTATAGGERMAVLPTGGDDIGSTVAARQAPLLPAGRLVVLDDSTDGYIEVEVWGVVAFFWDPTGERLLLLEVTEAGTLHWQVWEDDTLRSYPEFSPSPTFLRDLVPFFDQYAQSMSLWSPDGSAFAFPGTVDDVEGIWVQELTADEPTRVAGGTWVAWSSG